MGCTKCGTDTKLIDLLIQSAIQKMLDEGKLQAGIHDCAETNKDSRGLPRGSKVVLCDQLGKQICALIETGEICFIKPITLDYNRDNGEVTLGLSDGETLTTTIEFPKDKALDKVKFDSATGTLKFTMNDETTVHTVDLSELKVKVKAVKQDDGTVVITNQDGSTVTIDPVRKGDKGDKGDKGADGRQGVDGKSAYQIWLDRGNTGSEQDFINSLKGAAGAKGAKGDKGDKGEKGEKGEPGAPATGGLDCAAIDALPERPWKKGTTIVAKQDNQCIRLTALDSIFQEVGVGITANRTNGLTGEKYHVVVTVTNTGEGKNDRTNLTITRPQLGNYTTSNFTISKQGVEVAKTDDWNYVLTNLTKGGTARIEFDVTPNAAGTLQFGASVNPNTALDQQSNNNSATLTLSAQTPQSDAPVTVECPLISATWENKPLLVNQYNDTYNYYVGTANDRGNIFGTKRNLSGVSIKLNNVGSVQVVEKNNISIDPLVMSNDALNYGLYVSKTSPSSPPNTYTYNASTGILTINKAISAAFIILNPKNTSCRKQYLVLSASYISPSKYGFTTTAPTKEVSKEYTNQSGTEKEDHTPKMFASSQVLDNVSKRGWLNTPSEVNISSYSLLGERITITVPKDSRSYTVTYTPKNGNTEAKYFENAFQQGNLSVTSNGNVLTFTANADALPTDTYKFKNVTLKVV